jgi:hypothetical protein
MTDEEMRAIEAEIPLRDFAVQSSSAFWMDYAEELYDSAVALIRSDRDKRIARSDPFRGSIVQSPHSRAYLLLAAFAMENALKGIAVARNPQLVANGRLAECLTSHGLLSIADKHAKISLTVSQRTTCGVLESAIPTWGRYPVAKKATVIVREKSASDAVERDVDELFTFLLDALRDTLKEPWQGPHGATVTSGTIPIKNAGPNGPA